MPIPKPFRERYAGIVDDPGLFFETIEKLIPKSFRVNTIKSSSREVRENFEGYGIKLRQMPWYPDAFVSDEPNVGSVFEHFLGKIYLQELVSMLPPLVLKNELGDYVLDACAAPGSKTTQIAAMMQNKGTLVANDISYSRIKALKFNLEKAGALNTVITNQDLRFFPSSSFDSIILDAPCSSEGTVRKNSKLFNIWSEKKIHGHSSLQKQLVLKAFDLLKSGSAMVYSTCTFAPEENESVIDHLLQKREAKLEKIKIPDFRLSPGITEWNGKEYDPEIEKVARVWPHHNDTGGFFLAKVRK